MKIQEIQIKGLFGKKDIRWELNPQVNVLVGINGSGKSTILSIVHNFLIQKIPNTFEQLIDSAKMLFPKKGLIYLNLKIKDEAGRKVTSEEEVELLELIKNAKKLCQNKKVFPDNELAEINDATLNKFIQDFPEILNRIYILLEEERILNTYHYTINDKISEIIRYRDKYFYIDFIKSSINNLHANQQIDIRTRSETNTLDLEIADTINELNKIKTDKLIEQLPGSLNVFFNQIGKYVSYENDKLVYTDTQLQKTLNYSDLSSGERQLIYILLRVALSNGDKSKTAIILMDEPEISLHLDWQEHFIKQLTILNPDAQFIIVTHSPALIMNGWNDVYVDMEEITTWL